LVVELIIFRITPCKVFWTRLYQLDGLQEGLTSEELITETLLYRRSVRVRKGMSRYSLQIATNCDEKGILLALYLYLLLFHSAWSSRRERVIYIYIYIAGSGLEWR